MGAIPVDGRTAVISGAGSGIGRALAVRLSAHGCPVALTDWNADGLAETASTITGPVLLRELDVRDEAAQRAWAAEVRGWAPAPLGLVCNNAGVVLSQWAAEADLDDDRWLFDINYWGVVHGTRAFLPILLKQGSGIIANVSSVLGLLAFPTQSAYCAAKFAVRGYTEAVRLELHGTGVRAVTVHPGGVRTPITRSGRVRAEVLGRADVEAFHRDFETVARTSPQQAARVIHHSIERGKRRIVVGRDARFTYAMAHAMPTRWFSLVRPTMRVASHALRVARRLDL